MWLVQAEGEEDKHWGGQRGRIIMDIWRQRPEHLLPDARRVRG